LWPHTTAGWIGFITFVWWIIAIDWEIFSPAGVFPNSLQPYVLGMPMSWFWWMFWDFVNMFVNSLLMLFHMQPKDLAGPERLKDVRDSLMGGK
jgi:hypothetical protein